MASSAQAADRSLPRNRESSFPSLGLLSPRRPLRWVAAGAPLGAPGTAQRLSGPAGCPARAARGAAAPVTKAKKEPGVDARPVLALSVQLSAAVNPRIGGRRGDFPPAPSFPPLSLERKRCRRRPGLHRRHKLRIARFAASGKARSLHCALAPVAALRFPGQTGPPIAPLLFPGLLYPPLAALRRGTLPTEPAAQPLAALPPYGCGVPLAGTSLGFGGGQVAPTDTAVGTRAGVVARHGPVVPGAGG